MRLEKFRGFKRKKIVRRHFAFYFPVWTWANLRKCLYQGTGTYLFANLISFVFYLNIYLQKNKCRRTFLEFSWNCVGFHFATLEFKCFLCEDKVCRYIFWLFVWQHGDYCIIFRYVHISLFFIAFSVVFTIPYVKRVINQTIWTKDDNRLIFNK